MTAGVHIFCSAHFVVHCASSAKVIGLIPGKLLWKKPLLSAVYTLIIIIKLYLYSPFSELKVALYRS